MREAEVAATRGNEGPPEAEEPRPEEAKPANHSPWPAAFVAGIFVGTLVVVLFCQAGVGEATIVLFGGAVVAGAVYGRFASVLGMAVAILAWSQLILALLVPPPDSEIGLSISERDATSIGVILAFLIASAGHGLSVLWTVGAQLTRRGPRREKLAIVAGLSCVVAIVGAVVFVRPASASYRLPLPDGWTEGCPSFSPGDGTFKTPYACGHLERYAPSSVDQLRPGEDCLRMRYHDDLDNPFPIPPYGFREEQHLTRVAGAFEEDHVGPNGERVFVLGLRRQRMVVMTSETICYVFAVGLPPGSPVRDSDVETFFEHISF